MLNIIKQYHNEETSIGVDNSLHDELLLPVISICSDVPYKRKVETMAKEEYINATHSYEELFQNEGMTHWQCGNIDYSKKLSCFFRGEWPLECDSFSQLFDGPMLQLPKRQTNKGSQSRQFHRRHDAVRFQRLWYYSKAAM